MLPHAGSIHGAEAMLDCQQGANAQAAPSALAGDAGGGVQEWAYGVTLRQRFDFEPLRQRLTAQLP